MESVRIPLLDSSGDYLNEVEVWRRSGTSKLGSRKNSRTSSAAKGTTLSQGSLCGGLSGSPKQAVSPKFSEKNVNLFNVKSLFSEREDLSESPQCSRTKPQSRQSSHAKTLSTSEVETDNARGGYTVYRLPSSNSSSDAADSSDNCYYEFNYDKVLNAAVKGLSKKFQDFPNTTRFRNENVFLVTDEGKQLKRPLESTEIVWDKKYIVDAKGHVVSDSNEKLKAKIPLESEENSYLGLAAASLEFITVGVRWEKDLLFSDMVRDLYSAVILGTYQEKTLQPAIISNSSVEAMGNRDQPFLDRPEERNNNRFFEERNQRFLAARGQAPPPIRGQRRQTYRLPSLEDWQIALYQSPAEEIYQFTNNIDFDRNHVLAKENIFSFTHLLYVIDRVKQHNFRFPRSIDVVLCHDAGRLGGFGAVLAHVACKVVNSQKFRTNQIDELRKFAGEIPPSPTGPGPGKQKNSGVEIIERKLIPERSPAHVSETGFFLPLAVEDYGGPASAFGADNTLMQCSSSSNANRSELSESRRESSDSDTILWERRQTTPIHEILRRLRVFQIFEKRFGGRAAGDQDKLSICESLLRQLAARGNLNMSAKEELVAEDHLFYSPDSTPGSGIAQKEGRGASLSSVSKAASFGSSLSNWGPSIKQRSADLSKESFKDRSGSSSFDGNLESDDGKKWGSTCLQEIWHLYMHLMCNKLEYSWISLRWVCLKLILTLGKLATGGAKQLKQTSSFGFNPEETASVSTTSLMARMNAVDFMVDTPMTVPTAQGGAQLLKAVHELVVIHFTDIVCLFKLKDEGGSNFEPASVKLDKFPPDYSEYHHFYRTELLRQIDDEGVSPFAVVSSFGTSSGKSILPSIDAVSLEKIKSEDTAPKDDIVDITVPDTNINELHRTFRRDIIGVVVELGFGGDVTSDDLTNILLQPYPPEQVVQNPSTAGEDCPSESSGTLAQNLPTNVSSGGVSLNAAVSNNETYNESIELFLQSVAHGLAPYVRKNTKEKALEKAKLKSGSSSVGKQESGSSSSAEQT